MLPLSYARGAAGSAPAPPAAPSAFAIAASAGGGSAVYGASFAPLMTPLSASAAAYSTSQSNSWWSRYLRRGLAVSQWDLEYTLYQMAMCVRAPARVYKLTQHRKQTKNTWARDDPSFTLILIAFIMVTAVAFAVAYRYTSPLDYAYIVTRAVLTFVMSGVVASLGCMNIANGYMRAGVALPHSVEQSVEWLYAWDVHCNAYVSVFALTHVLLYALLPLVMTDGVAATLTGNAIYALAASYYVYVTFSGYLVLPFLQRQNMFLLPIAGIALLFLLLTLLGVNVARVALGTWVA